MSNKRFFALSEVILSKEERVKAGKYLTKKQAEQFSRNALIRAIKATLIYDTEGELDFHWSELSKHRKRLLKLKDIKGPEARKVEKLIDERRSAQKAAKQRISDSRRIKEPAPKSKAKPKPKPPEPPGAKEEPKEEDALLGEDTPASPPPRSRRNRRRKASEE